MTRAKPAGLLKRSLPSLISVAFHTGVFGLIMFIPWAVQPQSTSKELVITASALEQATQEIRFEDPAQQETTEPQHEVLPDDQEWARKSTENLLRDLTDRTPTKDTVISLGAGGGRHAAFSEVQRDRFKISAGLQGPRFFDQGDVESQATRVVYVLDSSGSWGLLFDDVKLELQRSIDRLTYFQWFHIIFFGNNRVQENPPKTLVRAIKVNKRKAFKFLQTIEAKGRSDPTGAMRRAFSVQPEIIFLLSDGFTGLSDPDVKDFLENLREWNKNKKVKIYTIGIGSRADRRMSDMERIAREHGGQFKFIYEDDLVDFNDGSS